LQLFAHSTIPDKLTLTLVVLFWLLTKEEQQVLTLICQGLSNEQIAANLSISINTVKMHIQNIFKKTNVSSRGQLSYVFTQV
jgi:DNA-binding NarL/FixJ family response regulator